MTAKRWYRAFISRYSKDRTIKKLEEKLEKGGSYSGEDSEWTKAMKRLLIQMAKAKKYQIEDESRVVGGKRADQRWLKGKGSVVAIEHENRNDKNLTGEINKLCNDVSRLKVLITYVSDNDFDKNVKSVKKIVEEAIDNHIDSFTGESLLLVSGYYRKPEEESWKAFRSALSSRLEILS